MGSNVITLTLALFVGPGSVGKTAIARKIAKAFGWGYIREANVGGNPDAHIFGLSAEWGSARAGIVTEADIGERPNSGIDVGIHPELDFYVHSQNPIGKAKIEGLFAYYLKHKNREVT